MTGDWYWHDWHSDMLPGFAQCPCENSIAYLEKDGNEESIHIHFINAGSRDVQIRMMESGIIDFTLLSVVPLTRQYAHIKLPVQDTWGLLIRKDDPLSEKGFVEPTDMKDIPLVSGRSENFRSMVSGWLGFDFNQLNFYRYVFPDDKYGKTGGRISRVCHNQGRNHQRWYHISCMLPPFPSGAQIKYVPGLVQWSKHDCPSRTILECDERMGWK